MRPSSRFRVGLWFFLLLSLCLIIVTISPALSRQGQKAPKHLFEANLVHVKAQDETYLCGEVTTVTECGGGFFLFALDPCNDPGVPYMLDVAEIPGGPGQFVALRNPDTGARDTFCSQEYGDINRGIFSFESWSSIGSCAECPVSPAPTATSTSPAQPTVTASVTPSPTATALPSATPTSTPPAPTETPVSTETPAPPTETPSATERPAPTPTAEEAFTCGRIEDATACGGRFFRFVLNPCRGGELDSVALFETTTIPGDSGDLVRLINPEIDTGQWCSEEFGDITQMITGYGRAKSISSCSECGLSPIVTPTPQTGDVDLDVVNVAPDPSVPDAREDFSVVFSVRNKSRNTRYDPGSGHYEVEVKIIPRLEDGWTLPFNSRDQVSAQHLEPEKLPSIPPLESVQIKVSGLAFPLGFDDGDLQVKLVPESKDINPENNMRSGPLSISGTSIGVEQCTMAFVKFFIGKLLKLAELGKIPTAVIGGLVDKSLDVARNIDIQCQNLGGYASPECISFAVDELASITNGLSLSPPQLSELLSGVIKLLSPPIREASGCFLWATQVTLNLMEKLSTTSAMLNGVTLNSASQIPSVPPAHIPAHILITNSKGQQVGVLEDGTVIQEIPGARVVDQDILEFLFYPGNDTTNLRVDGFGEGVFNLQYILAVGNSSVKAAYRNVSSTANMVATIDTGDGRFIMAIDEDGDGTVDQTKVPDSLTIRQLEQQPGEQPTCEESGGICFEVAGSEAPCPNGGDYLGWCRYDPETGVYKKCCGPAPAVTSTPAIPEQLPTTGEQRDTIPFWILGLMLVIAVGLLFARKVSARQDIRK